MKDFPLKTIHLKNHPETEGNDDIINQVGITTLDYANRYGCYFLRINEKELSEK